MSSGENVIWRGRPDVETCQLRPLDLVDSDMRQHGCIRAFSQTIKRGYRVNRRITLSRTRETSLSKPLTGSEPQKVIEPTENTSPPPGRSK